VVLAGGEGIRLRPLVRFVHGDERPKQYACFLDDRSLLRHTLDRVSRCVPIDRIVVSTHQRQERYLLAEFAGATWPHVLRQPEDRGTGAGILLPVHWISWRDPEAVVLVFPSDHFILGEEAFLQNVLDAAAWARLERERLVLVGATPTGPEVQYGWIEPGKEFASAHGQPICEVVRFVEKPDADTAEDCRKRGGLWNTFVMVGTAAAFIELGGRALPVLRERLVRLAAFAGTADEAWALRQAYALAPDANFSRAVLEPSPHSLAVSRLPTEVTWSDWGTPDRVVQSLHAAGLQPPWLQRLEAAIPAAAS
jgi:mannose-1-phosphate guanylyltransferase